MEALKTFAEWWGLMAIILVIMFPLLPWLRKYYRKITKRLIR